jgi:predicted glycoside hydrolase/deacetylase ChbG (UPF0249 family)
MRRPLHIVADDFGLTPAVDRAVFAALSQRVVSTPAFMPTAPRAEDLLRTYCEHGYTSIGWHITLSEPSHRPSSRHLREFSAALCDSTGAFAGREQAFQVLVGPEGSLLQQLRSELRAQLERIRCAGLNVSHVSSHHHVHVIPSVADALMQTLREANLGHVPIRGYGQAIGPSSSGAHRWLREFARSTTHSFERNGFATTRTLGFETMHSPDLATLSKELEQSGCETAPLEWMVHIADYGPGELHLSLERQREFALVSTLHASDVVRDFEIVDS